MRLALLPALLAMGCARTPDRPVPFSAPADFKAALVRVLDKYDIVVRGLAEDNLTLGKNALSAMHGELHAVPRELLDSIAKAHYQAADFAIMEVLHDTALAGGDLAVVRRVFAAFTPLFADLLERYGVTKEISMTAYRCPKEGETGPIWLQREGAPANPYLGAAGRECGEPTAI